MKGRNNGGERRMDDDQRRKGMIIPTHFVHIHPYVVSRLFQMALDSQHSLLACMLVANHNMTLHMTRRYLTLHRVTFELVIDVEHFIDDEECARAGFLHIRIFSRFLDLLQRYPL